MQNNGKTWADDPARAPWLAPSSSSAFPAPDPGHDEHSPDPAADQPRHVPADWSVTLPSPSRPAAEPMASPPLATEPDPWAPPPLPGTTVADVRAAATMHEPREVPATAWSPSVAPPAPPHRAERAEHGSAPGYAGRGTPNATADALSHELLVRARSDRPLEGWRSAVYTATRGRVNPGLSRMEEQRRHWTTRIRQQLPGCHEITVASMKGGVGKTTVATLLGLVLAEVRGDRVIALDANPDAGTLADRILGHSVNYTVRDLINNLDTIQTLTDIARYTNLAGRLQVLASEQDPAMSESFNKAEYEQVTAVLKRFYNIIITDSGTGLLHSAMHGALEATKTLVIVGAPTVDAGSRASKTLDWLMAHGYRELVANAVVALSCDRFSREIDRAAFGKHFESRCRAVVQIPEDPHLATGGHVQFERLHARTRDAALSLGAAVADQFGESHPHRMDAEEIAAAYGERS
jgi:MinD-like ATPase involved in chromosome partitioning or flagellar assembly